VRRRTFRPLVYALMAVQLMLSVPVASVWASEVPAEAVMALSIPCDGMQPAEHHSKHCPCCPDGAAGASDCQAACVMGVAILPVAHCFLPNPVAVSAAEPQPVNFLLLADPPLKPPPIV
jgi:hypothetical protein